MTQEQLYALLKTTGFPVRYSQFKIPPALPYIVYVNSGGDNISADDKVWDKVNYYRIELYTKNKDFASELILETILDNAGIFYAFSNVGIIESEKINEVYYEIQI